MSNGVRLPLQGPRARLLGHSVRFAEPSLMGWRAKQLATLTVTRTRCRAPTGLYPCYAWQCLHVLPLVHCMMLVCLEHSERLCSLPQCAACHCLSTGCHAACAHRLLYACHMLYGHIITTRAYLGSLSCGISCIPHRFPRGSLRSTPSCLTSL